MQAVPGVVEHLGLISATEEPEVIDLSANLPKPIEYYRAKRAKWLAGKPVKREITPNLKRHKLPDGFRMVVPDAAKLSMTSDKLPWLKHRNGETSNSSAKQYTASLALVTLSDTGNQRFYLGSFIRHPYLLGAASRLKKGQSNSVNQLFYSCLPNIIRDNFHPAAKPVEDPVGGVNIFGIGNEAGQRAYFMRFDPINGLPVIVKVAVCDKAAQDLVLGVLSTQDYKDIKKFGKL